MNVDGHNIIPMDELRIFFDRVGFAHVKSLLQSGNIVFDARLRGILAERILEVETENHFGVAVDYFVRDANEWDQIIAGNPFPDQATSNPSRLVVYFMKDEPEPTAVEALQASIKGPEIVRAVGKQLYAVYPAGIGRSKLTIDRIEKTLETRGTGRNWNTVLKLAPMVKEVFRERSNRR